MTIIDLVFNIMSKYPDTHWYNGLIAIGLIVLLGYITQLFIGTRRIGDQLKEINETLKKLIKEPSSQERSDETRT